MKDIPLKFFFFGRKKCFWPPEFKVCYANRPILFFWKEEIGGSGKWGQRSFLFYCLLERKCLCQGECILFFLIISKKLKIIFAIIRQMFSQGIANVPRAEDLFRVKLLNYKNLSRPSWVQYPIAILSKWNMLKRLVVIMHTSCWWIYYVWCEHTDNINQEIIISKWWNDGNCNGKHW